MLITVTLRGEDASDLGFLLHKHPDRVRTVEVPHGTAHVFFPEAGQYVCTAALLLELDPVALVRRGRDQWPLAPYVNDRPYTCNSFMSVAMARLFGTALSAKNDERHPRASHKRRFELTMQAVPCRGGDALVRQLFEPLGYAVTTEGTLLDPVFPDWGEAPIRKVTLAADTTLRAALTHLYVLIPVLDDRKHYWVGRDEVEKLLRFGEGWLASHPARDVVARRYLSHSRSLSRQALERLAPEADAGSDAAATGEARIEAPMSLQEKRVDAVLQVLVAAQASSAIDLGCGEGTLLRRLVKERQFRRIAGCDIHCGVLERAAERLHLEHASERTKQRIALFQGAVTYRDERFTGFDAAVLMEVIEHLEPSRLAAVEEVVWRHARPRTLVVTTPNREYNAVFPGLAPGQLRHGDHRFEWSRQEFEAWAQGVASRNGYAVQFTGIGDSDPERGAPTQMAVFTR